MKWEFAFVMVVGLFLAGETSDEAAKQDLAKCQGTWQPVSMETDGKAASTDELSKIKLAVKGPHYHFQNGSFSEHGWYNFQATKDPKQLDIVVSDGKDKGKIYLVIYKVEGDELTICLETANSKRPKEFTGKAGSGQVLEVWQRAKT
jgi:uncharacterized protein (TIGR03067 family)